MAIGTWAAFSYNPDTMSAVGEPDELGFMTAEVEPNGGGDRDSWQKPDEVIYELHLKPKQVVADIGAGEGYFSFRIATTEPTVKVYAAEIEKEMVKDLAETAKERAIRNVLPFQINPSTPNLPEKIDLALLVDTYHEMNNRIEYFEKLRSFLRPNGRIAIIDVPTDSIGAKGEHKISKDNVVKELTAAGFRLDREVAILPEQYFLIFKSTSNRQRRIPQSLLKRIR